MPWLRVGVLCCDQLREVKVGEYTRMEIGDTHIEGGN